MVLEDELRDADDGHHEHVPAGTDEAERFGDADEQVRVGKRDPERPLGARERVVLATADEEQRADEHAKRYVAREEAQDPVGEVHRSDDHEDRDRDGEEYHDGAMLVVAGAIALLDVDVLVVEEQVRYEVEDR